MFRIFVNNIPFSVTSGELRELFVKHGAVQSVNLLTDQYTDKPRGCAIVEMVLEKEGKAAIGALDGYEMYGRLLAVGEAEERGTLGSRGTGKREKRW